MCATLIVLSHAEPLEALVTSLRSAGIDARGVRSFEGAREQLNRRAWDVLLTEVRLGPYNGLQLAVRTRATHPQTAIILVGESPDPAIDAEIISLGAQYVADASVEQLASCIVAACSRRAAILTKSDAADAGSIGVA
jgi:DNA-binding NtrC family response regulator